MAKNININRGVNDPYYRYKMPRIMAKVEGKGNGIKTVVANMSEIAKALDRPPTYPTKYFGCELGAQTNFDVKNDRYIVNGEHDASKLQDILDGFIKKFVLCPSCENPETTLNIKGNQIQSRCKACGHNFTIDPKHKLSTFIIKNPPPKTGADVDSKDKREGGGSPNGEANGFANGEESQILGLDSNSHLSKNADDDWAPLPETEQEKLSAQIGKLVLDRDLEKSTDERLDMLHAFFIKAKKDGTIQDFKTLLNEAERLELKTKAPLLLSNVLFDLNVVKQIQIYRNVLLRFCYKDAKAQRHLLGGIEQLILKNKDELLTKSAHIVKALYDNDICEEDVLLNWGSKPSRKYIDKELSKQIIKVVQPFLTWLEEAEEDSESEESDDGADGVAVNFDERGRNLETTTIASDPESKKDSEESAQINAVKDENGEDIDIDDI